MPELPEVETVRRGLEQRFVGRLISEVTVGRERVVRRTSAQLLTDGLRGARVTAAQRRGKYLLCPLDNGNSLMIHLRMSGQLLSGVPGQPRPAHTHVVMSLDDGSELWFVDPRTFGEMVVYREVSEIPELTRLGRDPLLETISATDLAEMWRGRTQGLKAFLLDQRWVAGIGNIYSDEIAHRAGIHPLTPVGRISGSKGHQVATAISLVLGEAVAAGGSTLGDSQYVDVMGRSGGFQDRHRVYGRTGQRCGTCGRGLIQRIVVAQRSTHLCRVCQPLRSPTRSLRQ
jgi:formamidopyrimidine-DNA glycosylase